MAGWQGADGRGWQGWQGADGRGWQGWQGPAGSGNDQLGISSDIRLKENIVDLKIDNVTSKLNSLRKIKFNYKSDENKITHYGIIAQEIQQFFPELVTEDANGNLLVDNLGLFTVILMAIDELKNK